MRTQWELLVRLLQRTFGDGNLQEELAWVTLVLIPKGRGGYQGIGLVEVSWKVFAVVVSFWLKRGAVLHDALPEAKLDQQLAVLAHKPLFQVFLEIHKVYDSLDR